MIEPLKESKAPELAERRSSAVEEVRLRIG